MSHALITKVSHTEEGTYLPIKSVHLDNLLISNLMITTLRMKYILRNIQRRRRLMKRNPLKTLYLRRKTVRNLLRSLKKNIELLRNP